MSITSALITLINCYPFNIYTIYKKIFFLDICDTDKQKNPYKHIR